MPILCLPSPKAHAPEKENHLKLPKTHPDVNNDKQILSIFFFPHPTPI